MFQYFFLPAIVLAFLARVVYNIYRPGISHIPGPWICKITDAYRVYRAWRGDAFLWWQELQSQYGNLVRIGPNTILDCEQGDMQKVFGFKEDYEKSDSIKVWIAVVKGRAAPSIVSVKDKIHHGRLRKPIAALYSNTNVQSYQPRVTETIKYFLKRLDEEFMQGDMAGRRCDIENWVQYFAFDIVGQLTLSRRLGFLEAGSDVDTILEELEHELDYRGVVQNMPWIDKVLRKNPIYLRFKTPTSFFAANSRRLATERLQDEKHAGVDMLDGFLEAKKKHPEIVDDATLFGYISTNFLAGSDTTAVTLRTILWYVIRTPGVLDRLRKELDENITSYPPDYATATGLKYLDAIIREALRIHPIGSLVFERVVPPTGHITTQSGTHLPAGTQIAQTPWTLNWDSSIWGPEPRKFKPERWLQYENESDDTYAKRLTMLKNYDFSFSHGPRACLGKHIAWMEIVEVVPTLFGLLDIRFADPNKEWDIRGAFFAKQHNMDVTLQWREGVDKALYLD